VSIFYRIESKGGKTSIFSPDGAMLSGVVGVEIEHKAGGMPTAKIEVIAELDVEAEAEITREKIEVASNFNGKRQ
jgi:hypothetical protein